MDLKLLKDTPPWNWPKGASKMFLEILNSNKADESDRLLAAELAGVILFDLTKSNDEDIVDAAYEAMAMTGEGLLDEDYDDEKDGLIH